MFTVPMSTLCDMMIATDTITVFEDFLTESFAKKIYGFLQKSKFTDYEDETFHSFKKQIYNLWSSKDATIYEFLRLIQELGNHMRERNPDKYPQTRIKLFKYTHGDFHALHKDFMWVENATAVWLHICLSMWYTWESWWELVVHNDVGVVHTISPLFNRAWSYNTQDSHEVLPVRDKRFHRYVVSIGFGSI